MTTQTKIGTNTKVKAGMSLATLVTGFAHGLADAKNVPLGGLEPLLIAAPSVIRGAYNAVEGAVKGVVVFQNVVEEYSSEGRTEDKEWVESKGPILPTAIAGFNAVLWGAGGAAYAGAQNAIGYALGTLIGKLTD